MPGKDLKKKRKLRKVFVQAGADIRVGGSKAYYHPEADYVQIPTIEDFRDAESYAATMAHELIHWAGHSSPRVATPGPRGKVLSTTAIEGGYRLLPSNAYVTIPCCPARSVTCLAQ